MVEEFEIAVPRDDEVLDRLTFLFGDFVARRGKGFESRDPRRPGSEHYLSIAGRFRVRLIDSYRPVLWADIDPLPEAMINLPSINGAAAPRPAGQGSGRGGAADRDPGDRWSRETCHRADDGAALGKTVPH